MRSRKPAAAMAAVAFINVSVLAYIISARMTRSQREIWIVADTVACVLVSLYILRLSRDRSG